MATLHTPGLASEENSVRPASSFAKTGDSADCQTALRNSIIAAAIFTVCFALIWLTNGRVIGPLDEGIYLDGAVRMLQGQVIYRDFFALTGPGTFALISLIFRTLGVQLQLARLLPVLDIGLMAAGIYLLSLAGRRNPWPGLAAAICFVGLETTKPGFVSVCHRLDSAALILWSLILPTFRPKSRSAWFLSGLLAGAACWCTPPMAIVIVVVTVWLSLSPDFRNRLPWHAFGWLSLSGVALAWLAAHRALGPFWTHMRWTITNYSESNRFGYGGLMGGYEHPAYGSHPLAAAFSLILFTLPATLPLLVFLGSLRLLRSAKAASFPLMGLLLVAAAACLLSTWPRCEITRMSFVSVIFYGLAARLAGSFNVRVMATLLCAPALAFLLMYSRQFTASLDTVRGPVNGRAPDIASLEWVLTRIPAHSTLFIYPYAPNLYFFTAGENATRYSFLQPGMSTSADEASVIAALSKHPPAYILIHNISPEAVMKIWPNTDPLRIRTDFIDGGFLLHYELADANAAYKVYRARGTR
jgi:hypothetical protein